MLEDEDLRKELTDHLLSKEQYAQAADIVLLLNTDEMKNRFKIAKTIFLRAAQNWMKHLGYRWKKIPSEQYVDGHKRIDIVYYRKNNFIPA